MATDKPTNGSDVLEVEEEGWVDAEDPTVREDIVPYEGGIVPQAQWDIAAVFEGFRGVMLWVKDAKGEQKAALYYDIPNRGSGLTVRAMRILSAMRGGFEERDITVAQGQTFLAVHGPDGKPVVEMVPGVEAKVTVRDLVAGNTRIGYWLEPLTKERTGGGGWYAVPDPRGIAVAKAKRNAYAEHFAGTTDALLQAFRRECDGRRVFFSGEIPQHVAQASAARAGEVPDQRGIQQAVANAGLGVQAKNEIVDQVQSLEKQFGVELTAEFLAWGAGTFGTQKVIAWPARRRKEVDQWIATRAAELAEAIAGGEERPKETDDPFLEHAKAQALPTEAQVRERLKGLTKEQVAAAYEKAGLKPTSPLDDPDKCAALWEAMDADA